MNSGPDPVALRAVFAANVAVAGCAGVLTLFAPDPARTIVFQSADAVNQVGRITGAFWVAIAACSAIGLWRPLPMSAVLIVQLVYKGAWLAVVAAPAMVQGRAGTLPVGMAVFFLLWVLALPLVIPWSKLLRE